MQTHHERGEPPGGVRPVGGLAMGGEIGGQSFSHRASVYSESTVCQVEGTRIYKATEEFHAAGLCVIPLAARSKRPALASWKVYQTRRPDSSERWTWFGENPERNLGIVCGGISGNGTGKSLAVLDFDDPGAYETFAQDHPEVVSSTWVVRTGGGGVHVYLSIPGHVSTGKIVGGDLKAEGGYVLAPPSIHPNGTPYQWIHKGDTILEVKSLAALGIGSKANTKGPAPAIEGMIPEGERNATLASLGGTMRRRGMSEGAILSALIAENFHRCDPPLAQTEVRAIAKSVAKYEPTAKPGRAPTGEHLTDLGNARRLVALHGADLRYCFPWSRWIVWGGTRWSADDSGEVHRRAKSTVATIYGEASRSTDEDARKAIAKHAMRTEASQKLQAMIALARSELGIPVLPKDLDTHRWLLNLQNGTLNLRTATLQPHSQANMITKLAPVEYDPSARCPLWLAFLDRIMGGKEALIGFLQRAIGYALTGDVSERALFILYGTGANGKTTFLNVVSALLGEDYAQQTPTETLLVKRFGSAIPNDVARLRGARLITAQETAEGRRLAESLVKQMTGGDKLTARFLRAEFFEFRPEFKIFLATNHKPVIRGTDKAIWDRIRLIPFNVTIPEHEQDKHLAEKLEAELPGILCWALDGCSAWQRDGLGAPQEVKQATASYREEMDVIADFLKDCCVMTPNAVATKGESYVAYTKWCEGAGERALAKRVFGKRIRERGIREDKTGKGHVWCGIGLLGAEQ